MSKQVLAAMYQFIGTFTPAANPAVQGVARADMAPAATWVATRDDEHAVSMLSAAPYTDPFRVFRHFLSFILFHKDRLNKL